MHDDKRDGLGHESAPEPGHDSSESEQQNRERDTEGAGQIHSEEASDRGIEPADEPSDAHPTSETGESLPPSEPEKRTIFELLYGVIAKPVDTLRYIAEHKLVTAGIIIYIAVAWLGAIAALPGTLNSADLPPEFRQLPLFNPRIGAIATIIVTPFTAILGLLIVSGVVHGIAKLFKGEGTFGGILSAFGFASFPAVLAVPFSLLVFIGGALGNFLYAAISFLFQIWVLVLDIIAIRENYKLSTGQSIATCLIPLLVFVFLIVALVVGIAILIVGALSNQ